MERHPPAQVVENERLLRLAQSQFGRTAGVAYRRGRRSSCPTFRTGDDDDVGLGFRHTGHDSADAVLSHELHAHLGTGIDVFEVKNELGKVFDGINIVMRRRRDKRDAWYRVTHPGNDFVDLEARKLPSLTRFGTLGYLDLYFISVDEVGRRHAETSRGNLLDGATASGAEAGGILVEGVHGHRNSFVNLRADGSE